MTRALALALYLAAPLAASAQSVHDLALGARLTEATIGSPEPAMWLGGQLQWAGPHLAFDARGAGFRGWRGRLGGELAVRGEASRSLAGHTNLVLTGLGTVERPLGWTTAGELSAHLGLEQRVGPARLQGGVLLLDLTGATGVASGGGFARGVITLGALELEGSASQLTHVDGSLKLDPRADTLGQSGTARRLSHALFRMRYLVSGLELTGSAIRRTGIEVGNPIGWEAGIGIGAIGGTRFHAVAGTMPASGSWYLPYRKELKLGIELGSRRPDSGGNAPEFNIRYDREAGTLSVTVRHRAAGRIEIAGDFSDWEPVSLVRIDRSTWQTTVALPPGSHQINIRFDGGRWEVPQGLAATPDGLGGSAGILTIDQP